MSHSYKKQDRGGAADYAAYFAGMNQSMQQKVALTTAHFPPSGTVADMGSGSGQATHDLAALYEGLSLVGVDINDKAVAIAAQTFTRKNLRYMQGDIADPLFADGSLDGILDSSVLHHVTSFNGFSLAAVERLLDNQVAALKAGGVLIIRDFVVPEGPHEIELSLLPDDAALFRQFAGTFASSQGPVAYTVVGDRFRTTLRAATEFVLRKDYRDHWDTELLEEYTYWSQAQFEEAFSRRGLRIVVSVPLYNPWIIENRFRHKVAFFDLDGEPLPFPPTNYLIVGEKTSSGVRLVEEKSAVLEAPRFLKLSGHLSPDGRVYELVERPGTTVDVVPHFFADGRPFIVCKHGFPRPVLNAHVQHDLALQHGAGYVTEPLSAIVGDGESAEDAVRRVLQERAGITAPERLPAPWRYYTSPGGINERVDAYLVAVAPWKEQRVIPNYSAFTSSGTVRFLDATQVLRACHVGGMFDSRLELNIYRLCRSEGYALGPWIGAEIACALHHTPPRHRDVPAPAPFTRVPLERASFLEVREGTFSERDASGKTLKTATFEYVQPRTLSVSTLSMLPVWRTAEDIFVGLEHRDLPAASLLTLPAMRLLRDIRTLDAALAHGQRVLASEHDLDVHTSFPLGGRYAPSSGVTPEVVYPFVVDVRTIGDRCRLCFVALDEALALPLCDGHLLTSLYRFWHASSSKS